MAYRQVTEEYRLPIDRKLLLTVREAVEYIGIGEDKISAKLNEEDCPFAFIVTAHKRLIHRPSLEAYIALHRRW